MTTTRPGAETLAAADAVTGPPHRPGLPDAPEEVPAVLTGSAEEPPDDAELDERFRPVFARVAEGAVEREQGRELPYEQVRWLREAGFGALRVSRAAGGAGASLRQLFRLLVELARADSNVAHVFRGHFAFLEHQLVDRDPAVRSFWAREAVRGRLVGNASSEVGNGGLWDTRTSVGPDLDDRWVLNGTKYYSTGSIFADWISVGAVRDDGERVTLPVRTDAHGVELRDDWDGFGQRLTGSGTTVFSDVEVDPASVVPYAARRPSVLAAYFQTYLLAVLSGVAWAAVDDAVAFVRPRTRTYGSAAAPLPREDPLVLSVVGRLAAKAYGAEAAVLAVADRLDTVTRAAARGEARQEEYDAADVAAYQAQVVVVDLVLRTATELFEVGGASATSEGRRLDRHWRNARTIASHNPVVLKERTVGDWHVNGVAPSAHFTGRVERREDG